MRRLWANCAEPVPSRASVSPGCGAPVPPAPALPAKSDGGGGAPPPRGKRLPRWVYGAVVLAAVFGVFIKVAAPDREPPPPRDAPSVSDPAASCRAEVRTEILAAGYYTHRPAALGQAYFEELIRRHGVER